MASLTACKGNTLRALGTAHAAYISTELSSEAKAQIDALTTARASLVLAGLTGKALAGIDAQVKTLQGDAVERAWQAYKSVLRPTNGKKTGKARNGYHGVVKCPFKDDTLFVAVVDDETYTVHKLDGMTALNVTIPPFLDGYKLTSLSGVRRLAWAVHNNKAPANCHDGIGKARKEGDGGDMAQVVAKDATVWVNKHAPKAVKK